MRPARGLLEPEDLASERWLRGEGGVLDAIRSEMRHVLGLTQAEVRAGAHPRRVGLSDVGGREKPPGHDLEVRDELQRALRGLTRRERSGLLAYASGVPQKVLARRWRVTRGDVHRVLKRAVEKAQQRVADRRRLPTPGEAMRRMR